MEGDECDALAPKARPKLRAEDLPLLLTVEEAADVLRIGRNTCYELIRQRRLPFIRLGRLIRLPRFGLMNWLEQEAALGSGASMVDSDAAGRYGT
jgi:excisionase family DNA binding protein